MLCRYTSLGFHQLADRGERPSYFSDAVITKAERVYARVTNGLAETTVDFGEYTTAEAINISKQSATTSVRNISVFKSTPQVPYKELGSTEGFITKVEKDGYGRAIVWIRTTPQRTSESAHSWCR